MSDATGREWRVQPEPSAPRADNAAQAAGGNE